MCTTVPYIIFKEDIYDNNGKKYGKETLKLQDVGSKITTKCVGGFCPYFFMTDLCNNGKVFKCTDPQSGIEIDIYIIHLTHQKATGNLHVEMSTMHRNPGSDVWQATDKAFSQ